MRTGLEAGSRLYVEGDPLYQFVVGNTNSKVKSNLVVGKVINGFTVVSLFLEQG